MWTLTPSQARTIYSVNTCLLTLIVLLGCANLASDKALRTNTAVGDDISRATTHVQVAESLNTQAKPHSDPVGVTLLDAVTVQHSDTVSDLKAANAANAVARQQIYDLTASVDAANAKTAKVLASWSYRLGHTIIVWVTVIIVVWVVAGIASVALPLLVPGVGGLISGELMKLLPGMNIWGYILSHLKLFSILKGMPH